MTNDNNVLLLRQADFELSHTTACAVLASFLCDGAVLNCFLRWLCYKMPYTTAIRRPFDCLSKVINVIVT